MLKTLTLKNFRRHEALTVNFTEGLNVIRGANEQGKSTIIEAILYALRGKRALRSSIADAVTWGKNEKDLSVDLTLEVNRVEYKFHRSESGASVTFVDKEITGQDYVSVFASELLGVDGKTSELLIFAKQKELGGALDEGPTAVSGLISKLANFELIDKIIETAQITLTTGSDAGLKAKLTSAEQAVQACRDVLGSLEDPSALQAQVEALTAAHRQAESTTEGSQRAMIEADAALAAATAANAAHRRCTDALASLEQRLAGIRARLLESERAAAQAPAPEELERAWKDAEDADRAEGRVRAYKEFQKLEYPQAYWEGTEEAFREYLRELMDHKQRLEGGIHRLKINLTTQRQKLIEGGKCPTCGHEADPAWVQMVNSTTEAEIRATERALADNKETLHKAKCDIDDALTLEQNAKPFTRLNVELFDLDLSFFPPKASWKGEIPQSRGVEELNSRARELQVRDQEAQRAAGKARALIEEKIEVESSIGQALILLESNRSVDEEPLKAQFKETKKAYQDAISAANAVKVRKDETALRWRELVDRIQRLKASLSDAENRVQEYSSDLTQLNFNNTLISKLRKIKPVIADHLWGVVLSAVSTFFTHLRGEQSVVSKDSSGFKVNGKTVSSLSGSTEDILALGVRVALTKTFVPNASFIILDEPAAGCTVERTQSLLSFISTAGFSQVLLSTHDVLSETVADNLILVGG